MTLRELKAIALTLSKVQEGVRISSSIRDLTKDHGKCRELGSIIMKLINGYKEVNEAKFDVEADYRILKKFATVRERQLGIMRESLIEIKSLSKKKGRERIHLICGDSLSAANDMEKE